MLGPSESKELSVQFNPAMSGEFTGTVWLMIGSAGLEVSIQGRSYTEEEYQLTALEYFNWAINQEQVEGGILDIEDTESAMRVLLAGYKIITIEQLRVLLKTASILRGSSQLPSLIQPPVEQESCQQPSPSLTQLIGEARQFLVSQQAGYVIHLWEEVAQLIGAHLGLTQQDNFHYNFSAAVLAIKDLFSVGGGIDNILHVRFAYVLEQIKSNFNSDRAEAMAWIDRIIVLGRIHLSYRIYNEPWILVDFLRVVDNRGYDQPWIPPDPTINPHAPIRAPEGTMIDIIVRRPFPSAIRQDTTLLAFLKVDSSTPSRDYFYDPLRGNTSVEQMASNIITWINQVYKHIVNVNASTLAPDYWRGMRIAGWIFTNPQDPGMMNELRTRLETAWRDGRLPRDLPFFIAYNDGQPKVVCFGCTTQAEVMAVWMTACQLGGICVPVQVVGGGGPSNISDDMVFLDPGEGNSSDWGFLPVSLLADGGGGGGGGDEPPSCNE